MHQKKNRKVAKKICLLFVLFFHSNSIRLLLWKWHTHTQEREDSPQLFLRFSHFSFLAVSRSDSCSSSMGLQTRARWHEGSLFARHTVNRRVRAKNLAQRKRIFRTCCIFCWSFLGALQFQGFRFGWVCYSCISISMLFIVIAFVIATIW